MFLSGIQFGKFLDSRQQRGNDKVIIQIGFARVRPEVVLSIIIDAHEDIAWGTLCFGRDYLNSAYDIRRYEEHGPVAAITGVAMLGLPEWLKGGIAVIGATLFTPPERRRTSSLESYYA